MRRSMLWFVALPAVCAVAMALSWQPARAAGVVGDGTPASCTEAALLTVMSGGGFVTFNCGTEPVVITITTVSGITPTAATTVDGGGLVTLDGNNSTRLFHVVVGNPLTLTNIILRNGNAGNTSGKNGGCILNYAGAVLVLSNTAITQCSAFHGGGLDNYGTATVNNSTISGNFAYGGGGIANQVGTVTLNNTTLDGNSAYAGGGVSNSDGTATLNNTTVSGNSAFSNVGYGGGLVNWFGAMTVTNSIVISNSATRNSGGIESGGNSLTTRLALVGSMVSGNMAGEYGGGILGGTGTITLTNTTVSGNTAAHGGGIAVVGDGAVTLYASTVSNNTASGLGGGLLNGILDEGSNFDSTKMTLNNSMVSGNHAAWGGGISNDSYLGILNVSNSTISSNVATYIGGGLSSWYARATLNGSTVSSNTASAGGGIRSDGMMTLNNSTVSGNAATAVGGGIYAPTPLVYLFATQLRNVTISNNGAPIGGGLYISQSAHITLTNTIIAYSPTGGNCGGSSIDASQYSLSSDNSCALSGTGDLNNVNPALMALGNYGGPTQTHLPLFGSPAINAALGGAQATDQRGVARPQGAAADIGAVEWQASDAAYAQWLFLPAILR